jgi:hypothetical protein
MAGFMSIKGSMYLQGYSNEKYNNTLVSALLQITAISNQGKQSNQMLLSMDARRSLSLDGSRSNVAQECFSSKAITGSSREFAFGGRMLIGVVCGLTVSSDFTSFDS